MEKTITIPACQAVNISSAFPKTSFSEDGSINVALHENSDSRSVEWQSLLQFPLNGIPVDAEIMQARLCLGRVCGCMESVLVYRNLEYFVSSNACWQSRPKTESRPFACFSACEQDFVILNLLPAVKRAGVNFLGITLAPGTEGNAVFKKDQYCMPYLAVTYRTDYYPIPGKNVKIENQFLDIKHDFPQNDEQERFSPTFDASSFVTLTFFVKNTCGVPINFNIQLSPDSKEYMDDRQIFKIDAGELKAFTPYMFGKFMRARIAALSPGQQTGAEIWVQAQTGNYFLKPPV